MLGVPQLSLAVAVPAEGTEAGLHPRLEPAGHEVNTGASVSTVHVNVCVHVDELPQASVRSEERRVGMEYRLRLTLPRDEVMLGVPQLSLAVAVPAEGIEAGLLS